jgi:hypothetical protein
MISPKPILIYRIEPMGMRCDDDRFIELIIDE